MPTERPESGAIAIVYDEVERLFDLAVDEDGFRLQTDDGLQTAVTISLFTDRRATPAELQLAGLAPHENAGWAGDSYPELDGDEWGSLLWTLRRALRDDDTLELARQYARQALQWLVEDEVAQGVTCDASWIADTGYLELTVEIVRAERGLPRWRRVWNATTGELLQAA